jgi:hypothetical protein
MEIEYRLYYDETGNALFYTCEKPEGTYLVISAFKYALGDPNVMIKNGEIVKKEHKLTISKYYKSDEGTQCSDFDINIIVDSEYKNKTNYWLYKHVEHN